MLRILQNYMTILSKHLMNYLHQKNINLEKFIKLMDKKTKAITRVRYIKQIDPDTNKAVIVVRGRNFFKRC